MAPRLPPRTPTGDPDLVNEINNGIFEILKQAPIIGDFIGMFSGLFGKSSGHEARLLRVESILSEGSTGYDDLNRSNTSTTLGRGPQMTADWVQGGDGQALRIRDRAARLVGDTGIIEAPLPDDGRRWAKFPTPASQSKMTVTLVCDQSNGSTRAATTVLWCANEAFTEAIYAHVYGGGGISIGRATRSGNTWNFAAPWDSNPTARIGSTERIEGRHNGAGLYQLVVEGSPIVSHQDTSNYPIDIGHRSAGFAIQCWTGFAAVPEYGWGVAAFAMRSEDDTYNAIGAVETVANSASTTAMGAAVVATDAQIVANAAQETAEGVEAIANAAQATANAAQDAVQDALDGAEQAGKEWMVASGGVVLGRNEVNIGPIIVVPTGRDRRITSISYGMESNTGGITIQLLKVSPTRVSTVLHTDTIAAGTVEYQIENLNIPIENQHRLACNVTDVSGVSVLLCSVDGALL